MVFSLFKPKIVKPKVKRVERKVLPIYHALVQGLGEMDKHGCDRLVLTLYESEPDLGVRGRWISPEETRYYPFEMLGETEQEKIRDHQHYTIVSLVRDNVGNVITYPDNGLEIFQRTAVNPFLPALKDESNLRYVTKRGVYNGKDALMSFLRKTEADKRWTPEAIGKCVEEGIKDYDLITKRLMANAGIYSALENMEQREYTPFEQIMVNMRDKINASKNGGN